MLITHFYFRVRCFIQYWFRAKGPSSLHSPFLFALYNEVVKPSKKQRQRSIEALRHQAKKNQTLLDVVDFKSGKTSLKSVASLAKNSSSTPKFSAFLRLLIDHLDARTVLETGTSLGINTLYLASSNAENIITIEGSKIISMHATRHFKQSKAEKISPVIGTLQEVLEKEIIQHKPDFYFLDADHRSSSVATSIELILKHTPNTKCIIIHDIYWSKDMRQLWQDLIDDRRFTLSIDLFQAGIIFPKLEMQKQHVVLRF